MTAKTQAHGRQQLPLKFRVASGAESLVEGCGQHRRRYPGGDRRLDRPSPFAGVRYAARESVQPRIAYQCGRTEVEQPGCDHATPAPNFGDLTHSALVL